MKNMADARCRIDAFSNLDFTAGDLRFNTSLTSVSMQTNPIIPNRFKGSFFSENGYQITFLNNDNFKDLLPGTYTFSETTAENIVILKKFMGNPRFSQMKFIRDADWKRYTTSGSFTVTEQLKINTSRLTKGELNLKVSENGVLQHRIVRVPFEITSFD